MSNHFLTARGTDLPFSQKKVLLITHEQNIFWSKTISANGKGRKNIWKDNWPYSTQANKICDMRVTRNVVWRGEEN